MLNLFTELKKWDKYFLTLSVVYVVLSVLRFAGYSPDWLYGSVGGDSTVYGLSLLFIFIIFFSLERIHERSVTSRETPLKIAFHKLISDFAGFVGWRTGNQKKQVIVGLIVGLILPIYFVVAVGKPIGFDIGYTLWVILTKTEAVLDRVLIAPFFEEIFFRGFFITRFLLIFKNTKFWGIAGIVLSALLFASIHTAQHDLPNMFISGLIYGCIYLINWDESKELLSWRKNLTAALIAHSISNLMTTAILFAGP